MIGASLYIIGCTARNRVRSRLKRLREPRYLIGAIVGVAYIYFSVFARLRSQSAAAERRRARGRAPVEAGLAALAATAPSLVGLLLLVMTAIGWLIPFDSGLLDFSKAEVQFLFAAPVSRRALLVHRMLRSQIGMLFGSIVVGVVMPSTSGYSRLRLAVGMWLLLSTSKIYFTGISLARARLGASDRAARRVAWLPLAVMTAAVAVVAAALIPAFTTSPIVGVRDVVDRVASATGHGAAAVVMWPFIALATPLFAPWPWPYLPSVAGSAAVLAASVAWVLKSDATFQDAAEEVAVRKAGEARKAAGGYKARATRWQLGSRGRPEMVFAWKAALQTLRLVDLRSMIRLAIVFGAFSVAAASVGQRSGLAGAVAAFSFGAVALCVLLGPQAIRIDMRQDLQHLELLKTWPLPAAAVVRGQMLWPGVLISGLSWILLAVAILFAPAIFPRIALAHRLGIAAAVAIVAPALVFAQLAIHNGAALIFPAWVPLGNQRPRGLDAIGQRIIMLGGTWLALVALTLPGALAAGVVWFGLQMFVGPIAFIPAAAVCAAALFVEVLLITEMLGPAYERLDVLAVERSE